MTRVKAWVCATVLVVWALPLLAQQSAITASGVVPPLMKFSGVLSDVNGKPLTGVVGVAFYLYKDQQGGAPLWMETQNVTADAKGRYSVQLGATKPDGLPTAAFASGEARWLGVQVVGQEERPRVLLLSVPYALKAVDAETIGGLPPSAFMRANPEDAAPSGGGTASSGQTAAAIADSQAKNGQPLTLQTVKTHGGTTNFLPIWTGSTTIQNSTVFQSGSKVGIGTTSPAATLDVNGTLNLPQTTSASVGLISLGASGPFIHACCSVGNENTFVGAEAGNFTTTGLRNTAVGSDALHSNAAGQDNTASGVDALAANIGSFNTATGSDALSHNTTGDNNTASAVDALFFNTTGSSNTASGAGALQANTTGSFNTAIGGAALLSNTTGSNNAALGYDANVNSGNLTNATAIGARSLVSESNAIVLGCTFNCVPGTSQPFVGIGTTTPLAPLDVLPLNTHVDALIGDPGCGNGFAAIGFLNHPLGGCTNYALLGDGSGGTYLNASGANSTLHFRITNKDAMDVEPNGTVVITGNLQVGGSVSKGSGSFKIDHPLDPANKYLYHSFVESPDMMNIYNGNITTNKQGLAVVVLPSYFEALNRDFRYQLTVIGQFAQAIVAREINHRRFTIKTSRPGVKVSWQVTGIRHDAYADAHRIQVEEEKPREERGKYLHPELVRAPQEKAVGYSAPPQSTPALPMPVPATMATLSWEVRK